ncbi:uncharacterized protein LOC134224674 [Armigeres subalbatus]|uniref:uncharacterized protein LOC134224674 n=1 Tax=Armigeres subalbatus TaxID=124917 RepID=UPI002ED09051
MVSADELNTALQACGYSSLGYDEAQTIVKHINGSISNKNEAAMFIAQLIHESGGFQHRVETGRGHGYDYGSTSYYGRGYLQLTHDYNYRDASWDIFKDDRLVNNPDLVSNSVDMSMRVSVWFWETRVRPKGGPANNNFGLTTKAINGGLEPPGSSGAIRRFNMYGKVANALGVRNPASQ